MHASRPPEQHPIYIEYMKARNKPLVQWLTDYICSGDENALLYFAHHWRRDDITGATKAPVRKFILFLDKQFSKDQKSLESREITVLAIAYGLGIGNKVDIKKRRELLERTKSEVPFAENLLGEIIEPSDPKEAERLYHSAASRNCGRAFWSLYRLNKNEPGGNNYLKEGVKRKEPICLRQLALSGDNGNAAPKDQELEAASLLARNGHSMGFLLFASLQHQHEAGKTPPCPIRLKEAFEFLHFCTELYPKNESGQLYIAYWNGLGTPKSAAKACVQVRRIYEIGREKKANDQGSLYNFQLLLEPVLENNPMTKLETDIKSLEEEDFIVLFHASFILKNKELFNCLAGHPKFLEFVKQENIEEVIALLTSKNAYMVAQATKAELDVVCDAIDGRLHLDLYNITLGYCGLFHSSYLKIKIYDKEVNELIRFLEKCFKEKDIPRNLNLNSAYELLCKIDTKDTKSASTKFKKIQQEVANILAKPLTNKDLENEKIRLLGVHQPPNHHTTHTISRHIQHRR